MFVWKIFLADLLIWQNNHQNVQNRTTTFRNSNMGNSTIQMNSALTQMLLNHR